MRRRYSAWRRNSSRSGPGRPNCLQFAPKPTKLRQNSAAFGSEGWNPALLAEFPSGDAQHSEARVLSQSDPTDHALAAIASILDHPEPARAAEKPAAEMGPGWSERNSAHGYH